MKLFLRAYREILYNRDSKERHGKMCLLCNKILNLQSSLTLPYPKFVLNFAL